jgi:phthalate 4,5-dioxygenase oxygenase subunit
MLSQKENDLLTRVGAGAPMGELMRRYWIPAAFSHQIEAPDGPPVRVKLLGEKLVAFRDTQGRVGLVDERCPHRTASMYFGRNEECGLRCVYHGWKFDINGDCTDLPSEPAGSTLQRKVKIKAYPCLERGGVVWTYMGPAELKPEFPDLEWTRIPASHRYVSRHVQECNWLQGFEGGFDTSHLSFLHGGTADHTVSSVPSRYEVVGTNFGFIAGTGRDLPGGEVNWTANVMLMPFHKIIASQPAGAHVWVPMDDENTMLYSVDFHPARPLNEEELMRSKDYRGIHTQNIPGTDHAIANKSNDYLIDRALQAGGTSYTGMKGLGVQDCGIQESMGPIADRTIEHLGISDTAIIKIRRLMLQTLKDHADGKPLPGLDPQSWRVRSARFKTADGIPFADKMDAHVRIDRPMAAE